MIKNLDPYIDNCFSSIQSLILRYHKSIDFHDLIKSDYEKVSIQEGAKIFELMDYNGVKIFIADESTLMAGGTFKSLEACMIIALCKKYRYNKIVFSSGANLGSALTLYGSKAGLETFFFHPKTTLGKIDGNLFKSSNSHLITVDKSEKEVKAASALFSKLSGFTLVPEMNWRFYATGLRALFVYEFALTHDINLGWIVQTVCAGYGPIGFYDITGRLISESILEKEDVPKFLGIQQEVLSPMVNAWKKGHNEILKDDIDDYEGELMLPALYNASPLETYKKLNRHLKYYGGSLCTINSKEYDKYNPVFIKNLYNACFPANCIRKNPETIRNNAGLSAIAGLLKVIDSGIIQKGQNALVFLTEGAFNDPANRITHEYLIQKNDDLHKAIKNYLATLRV